MDKKAPLRIVFENAVKKMEESRHVFLKFIEVETRAKVVTFPDENDRPLVITEHNSFQVIRMDAGNVYGNNDEQRACAVPLKELNTDTLSEIVRILLDQNKL